MFYLWQLQLFNMNILTPFGIFIEFDSYNEVITNQILDVMELQQHTTADMASCLIKWRGTTFALMSAYLSDRINIEEGIEAMQGVAAAYRNVIICSDTNAWNTVWGSTRTDRRGESLGGFVSGHQLVILNEPSETPTFRRPRGHSWIDVTVASPAMARYVRGWTLRSETSSDHAAIAFGLTRDEADETSFHGGEPGYVTKRSNWNAYRSHLEGLLVDDEWGG